MMDKSESAGSGAQPRRVITFQQQNQTVQVELEFLSAHEVVAIDRAVQDVGDSGEVRLIVSRGRLRFIARVMTETILPEE